MNARWAFVALALLISAEVAAYFINPLHTASYDPRLRLMGLTFFRSPSRAMEPTIRENETFIVSVWPYRNADPRVGDVVVFHYPLDRSVLYVKRVVATGGSTVEIQDGAVVVDGRAIAEPYLSGVPLVSQYARAMPAVRVPANSYFVLGDNRDNSADSRTRGFVARSDIVGRVSK